MQTLVLSGPRHRRSFGHARHLKICELWLQEEVDQSWIQLCLLASASIIVDDDEGFASRQIVGLCGRLWREEP